MSAKLLKITSSTSSLILILFAMHTSISACKFFLGALWGKVIWYEQSFGEILYTTLHLGLVGLLWGSWCVGTLGNI